MPSRLTSKEYKEKGLVELLETGAPNEKFLKGWLSNAMQIIPMVTKVVEEEMDKIDKRLTIG